LSALLVCVLTGYASQLDELLTKKIQMMTELKGKLLCLLLVFYKYSSFNIHPFLFSCGNWWIPKDVATVMVATATVRLKDVTYFTVWQHI